MGVDNIAERLSMKHLEVSEEDLKESVKQQTEQPKLVDDDNPKLKERYSFHFSHTDGRGKVWEGDFVNQILNIKQRGQAAVLESTLNAGQPSDSINPLMGGIHRAIAHMVFSLEKRPPWAQDLREFHDTGLIVALYEEVAAHEDMFLGLESNQAANQKRS